MLPLNILIEHRFQIIHIDIVCFLVAMDREYVLLDGLFPHMFVLASCGLLLRCPSSINI